MGDPVCDVEYVWALVQVYAKLLYSIVCVMVKLTLQLALRHI